VRYVKHDIFIILFLILAVKKWYCSFKRAKEHYDTVKKWCLSLRQKSAFKANISAWMLKFDHIQFYVLNICGIKNFNLLCFIKFDNIQFVFR